MKANETPKKIYVHHSKHIKRLCASAAHGKGDIEYTRTDAFIEKAEEYLYKQLNEGNIECGDIETFIENFRKYMEGE